MAPDILSALYTFEDSSKCMLMSFDSDSLSELRKCLFSGIYNKNS